MKKGNIIVSPDSASVGDSIIYKENDGKLRQGLITEIVKGNFHTKFVFKDVYQIDPVILIWYSIGNRSKWQSPIDFLTSAVIIFR